MQNQAEFRVGNIVHLKSGSPDLKIVAVDGGDITVEWVNEKGVNEQWKWPSLCFVL